MGYPVSLVAVRFLAVVFCLVMVEPIREFEPFPVVETSLEAEPFLMEVLFQVLVLSQEALQELFLQRLHTCHHLLSCLLRVHKAYPFVVLFGCKVNLWEISLVVQVGFRPLFHNFLHSLFLQLLHFFQEQASVHHASRWFLFEMLMDVQIYLEQVAAVVLHNSLLRLEGSFLSFVP